jgi:hypothetical protein
MADLLDRVARYLSLQRGSVKIKGPLGEGTDGAVWATDRNTAVKAFRTERGYLNERDTYQRLKDYGITQTIAGFRVPEMQGFDDDLMVVEMDIMHEAPYLIDFAKVKLNREPDFSEITQAENDEQGQFLFEDDWPQVKQLLSALESLLIYYVDPKPHNIVCR